MSLHVRRLATYRPQMKDSACTQEADRACNPTAGEPVGPLGVRYVKAGKWTRIAVCRAASTNPII